MRNVKRRPEEHPFPALAVAAMKAALYERLVDIGWQAVKEVFARPDVQEAERTIMRALAEHFAPNGKKTKRKKR
jgi:arginyl-tRNA--protein-N-Asp/Glu arginylyltransferase